jgi:hypothetical protein
MQRVDVFDWALTNEKQNEQTPFFFFKSSTTIVRTASVLIPVISSNVRTLKVSIFGQTLLNDFRRFFCSGS